MQQHLDAQLARKFAYPYLSGVDHMFCHCLIAAGHMPQAAAARKLAELHAAMPYARSAAAGGAPPSLPATVSLLNRALRDVGMEVQWVRAEADGSAHLVFTNVLEDDLSKAVSAGAERDALLAVMKVVVNCLLEKGCVGCCIFAGALHLAASPPAPFCARAFFILSLSLSPSPFPRSLFLFPAAARSPRRACSAWTAAACLRSRSATSRARWTRAAAAARRCA